MIDAEKLNGVSEQAPKQEAQKKNRPKYNKFNGFEFCEKHNIELKAGHKKDNMTVYHLKEGCVFNEAHNGNDAYLSQFDDGNWDYKCQHETCKFNRLKQFIEKYEPDFFSYRHRQPIEWKTPESLEQQLQPVDEIPKEIIPDPFIPWLLDISTRMQCPLDFVAIGAMVVVATVVGAACAVRPKQKDDWEVIPNLWGGIVSRPSTLKSPALGEVMKPLGRLEFEYLEIYNEEMQEFGADVEVFKASKDAVKAEMVASAKGKKGAADMDDLKHKFTNMDQPKEPIRKRLKTNDTTIEKLGELLNDNPRGLLVFRDELVGLLCSWEREDRQQDRSFYLEGWNGNQGFTVDRIGRGTIDTKNICLSVLGGIQPAKLTSYLLQSTSSLTNDGMMQRFQLLVYPDEAKDWKLIDEYPDSGAKNKAYHILKKLADYDFTEIQEIADDERPYFHFDEAAQSVFNEWLTDLEEKIRNEDNPLIAEHLAKYRSLMPSLALLLHLIDVIEDGEIDGGITEYAAIKAAAWTEYLETHARRIYGLLGDIVVKSAAELAKKIKKRVVQNGFTARDVYRNEWYLLNREQTEAAIDELIDAGWIRPIIEEKNDVGRPTERYEINPEI